MRHTGIISLASQRPCCRSGVEQILRPPPPTTSKSPNAKEKIKDAAEATGEAAKAKRDEYAREMQQAAGPI